MPSSAGSEIDVLVAGAGPTGLALAAQLQWFGARFRIIDRSLDRARESRALAVQARTLEIFDSLRLADPLVARGNASTRVALHAGARTVAHVQLGSIGRVDTRFPFILFVSQSETERVLAEHLARAGATIERGVELTGFDEHETFVDCRIRHQDGREEPVRASYLAGCDGARSTVRKIAGFSFEGGSYPQDFVLGDIEADGPLEPLAINAFIGKGGIAIFFPLGQPTTWRVIAMKASDQPSNAVATDAPSGPLTLEELQSIVDFPAHESVRVRDPAWLTHFRLHHRQIERYSTPRVFLAGDAAHIHSPVGGQGMNTGIQDAWNLGWKLALVTHGDAQPQLLESYQQERWPVGHFLLRFTDRLFSRLTRGLSAGKLTASAAGLIVPRVLPRLLAIGRIRTAAFRFVSELDIEYRTSPAVTEGEPALKRGPRAGDRLPDAALSIDGRPTFLQREVVRPHHALLLCGDPDTWNTTELDPLITRGVMKLYRLSQEPRPGILADESAATLRRLAGSESAQLLIRPDGYIAFRCAGHDFNALDNYLARWFTRGASRAEKW
jgi:2-polyprenyl-6-methoxyphenol hydroxylase-like FAD-dependent oxidoreductase